MPPAIANIDKILARVARSRSEEALLAAARQAVDPADASGRLAVSLLMQRSAPQKLEAIDKLLARHGVDLGAQIGAGGESLVFDAGPDVVKIGRDTFQKGPLSLPDIPGVAPYRVSEVVGPYRVGVQPRAAEVASRQRMAEDTTGDYLRLWRDRSDTVFDSLDRRGYYFDDAGWANVGVMPDGNLAAIDGWITPQQSVIPRVMRKYPTAEDAIRALRIAGPR